MLSGCSSMNSKTEVISNYPIPDEYLVTCPVPVFNGSTDSELAQVYIRSIDSIETCNKRIEAIKAIKSKYSAE